MFLQNFTNRYTKNGDLISDCLALTGKTAGGKTLLEMIDNVNTTDNDGLFLRTYVGEASKLVSEKSE